MDVEAIRRFCLSFPNATEDMPWPDDLCFKVGGKIFAAVSLSTVPKGITFKCSPEIFAELVEREGITPAPYVGRYKWVRLEGLDVLRDAELKEFIGQSYEMMAAKAKPPGDGSRRARRKKKKGGRA
jgi:predicted DNA-binding protein (MmcQ/YjbR family)